MGDQTNRANPTWPRKVPVYGILGMLLALACTGFLIRWREQHASVLERFYFGDYLKEEISQGDASIQNILDLNLKGGPRSVKVVMAGGFVATPETMAQATRDQVRVETLKLNAAGWRAWLRAHVYGGRSIWGWFAWPLWTGLCLFIAFMVLGGMLDNDRNRKARRGRLLRGPMLISRWKFNRKIKGDGVSIRTAKNKVKEILAGNALGMRNLWEMIKGSKSLDIRFPKHEESHHFLILGGSGAGKSTINRQFIRQAMARGERFVIFDPDRLYVKEFGTPDDIVLDPTVDDVPYWAIEEEADNAVEGDTIAYALWPDEPNQQPFFKRHPRGIFAYLISRYNRRMAPAGEVATCRNLAYWLTFPAIEVAKRLKGTPWATSTDPKVKEQSVGVYSTLGEIVPALQMMPPPGEPGRRKFTVKEYVRTRPCNIFITSTPDTARALRPLQNAWLDMIILGLMTVGNDPRLPNVWLFLDEVADLNQLPTLKGGMTRLRKSGTRVVLSPQSWSQMEAIYGEKDAQTIGGMPFFTVVMRCKEPSMAKYGAQLLGEAEIERINESRHPHGLFGRKRSNFSTQTAMEPTVIAGELQSLPDLVGFIMYRGNVVKFKIAPMPPRSTGIKLMPRDVQMVPFDPPAEPEPEKSEEKKDQEEKKSGKGGKGKGKNTIPFVPKAKKEADAMAAASIAAGLFENHGEGPEPDWHGSVYGNRDKEFVSVEDSE